eukprot:3264740-Rhodomonas_salina.1
MLPEHTCPVQEPASARQIRVGHRAPLSLSQKVLWDQCSLSERVQDLLAIPPAALDRVLLARKEALGDGICDERGSVVQ